MNDVIIVDLKNTKIRACTARRTDGSFLTIINARIAQNSARDAYAHEVRHIERGDFDTADADAAERESHAR